MIVVTGATGQLGSRIVRHLLDRVPAARIGVSVRDPEQAGDLADRGVRVRRGDFTDPGSLAHAFEDAGRVLVVSANIGGPAAVAANTAATDAARAAGAAHVLYTSHQGAAADSLFPPMLTHAATEAHLTTPGAPFTALRNGFYLSTVERMIGPALQSGTLVAPEDGPVSWTTHADLAEAAAVLTADEGLTGGGPTPPLTAPECLDLADVAAILSDRTGRTVRRVVADDEEFVATSTANGLPEGVARMLLGMFLASRRGEFAVTGPALGDVLGRPATSARAALGELLSRR
ncbi:NAD(P)H-binding protein [Micromonospora sp. NPDC000089]|uniref:NmrA family NAD(P)-binding protein n=1 Tax=unclassified Micromonospora TaxID=2617518 RepID=UPI003687B369